MIIQDLPESVANPPLPGKIEMRWLLTTATGVRHLQFRYVYDWGGPHANWRWTEWQDVPTEMEAVTNG